VDEDKEVNHWSFPSLPHKECLEEQHANCANQQGSSALGTNMTCSVGEAKSDCCKFAIKKNTAESRTHEYSQLIIDVRARAI
jgi:hypothetical protein